MMHICHKCPSSRQQGQTIRVCGEDGRNIADHVKEGQCPLGKFGDASDSEAVKSYLRGIIGISKAIAGIGEADKQTIASRRTICRSCPEFTASLVGAPKCHKCGCFLWAKTKLASESCPLKKW